MQQLWVSLKGRATSMKLSNKLWKWWKRREFGRTQRIWECCSWSRNTATTSMRSTKVYGSSDSAPTANPKNWSPTSFECPFNKWASWSYRTLRKLLSTKTDVSTNPISLLRKCRETSTTLSKFAKNWRKNQLAFQRTQKIIGKHLSTGLSKYIPTKSLAKLKHWPNFNNKPSLSKGSMNKQPKK
jgi:hypothetical protein